MVDAYLSNIGSYIFQHLLTEAIGEYLLKKACKLLTIRDRAHEYQATDYNFCTQESEVNVVAI